LAVPTIAMSGLAGYQFGPKKTKKFFASFGPLFIHGVIPALDKLSLKSKHVFFSELV
jgi:alkane 1-monooxygenase